MPGFTHLQTAQPVTFGHHLLAWNEMIQRDYERLCDCRKRLNQSPLAQPHLREPATPLIGTLLHQNLALPRPQKTH